MEFIQKIRKRLFPSRKYKLELRRANNQQIVFETPWTDYQDIWRFARGIERNQNSKFLVLPKGVKVEIIPHVPVDKKKETGEGVGHCTMCQQRGKLDNCLCKRCKKHPKEEKDLEKKKVIKNDRRKKTRS